MAKTQSNAIRCLTCNTFLSPSRVSIDKACFEIALAVLISTLHYFPSYSIDIKFGRAECD